jgi:hypothetical protein
MGRSDTVLDDTAFWRRAAVVSRPFTSPLGSRPTLCQQPVGSSYHAWPDAGTRTPLKRAMVGEIAHRLPMFVSGSDCVELELADLLADRTQRPRR